MIFIDNAIDNLDTGQKIFEQILIFNLIFKKLEELKIEVIM